MKIIFWVLTVTTLVSATTQSKELVDVTINADMIHRNCINSSTINEFKALKENNFELSDASKKQTLSLLLLNCLASPKPEIRDEIAFSALSQWLRNDEINTSTRLNMFHSLAHTLNTKVTDTNGVYQPFSALTLAEVVRVDRKSPYLSIAQRLLAVDTSIQYFNNIIDYRGYDETIGWRHAVAHGADLMLQLTLNKKIEKLSLDKMLKALANQITAKNSHFYIYGEPERFARPVIYIFLRQQHSLADWEFFMAEVSSPHPYISWDDVFTSQQGLAKRHNTKSFLHSLYASIKNSENETLKTMVPALETAIERVN